MKTAGELLKEKRLTKELSLEAVAAKIKIKPEYLDALESSNFKKLPSATFAKGFLRNYAHFLRVNPDTALAMFRRDFVENARGEIVPRGLVEPVAGKTKIVPVNMILTGIAVATFLVFLGFELFQWWSLPRLTLLSPQEGGVYGEKVTIKGETNADSVVTIDKQKVIVDPSGNFSLDLIFPSGTHSVLVEATNVRGKTKLLERSFTVSK